MNLDKMTREEQKACAMLLDVLRTVSAIKAQAILTTIMVYAINRKHPVKRRPFKGEVPPWGQEEDTPTPVPKATVIGFIDFAEAKRQRLIES